MSLLLETESLCTYFNILILRYYHLTETEDKKQPKCWPANQPATFKLETRLEMKGVCCHNSGCCNVRTKEC